MADSLSMKVVIVSLLIIFSASFSWADDCLSSKVALDVQKATLFNESFKNSEKLMTSSKDGKYYSLLQLDSVYDSQNKSLSFYVNFDIGPDLVAIPYSVLGYEILLNDELIHKEDFTKNCRNQSPYTIMPGDYVELYKVKNINSKNIAQKLHIKVWGQ